MALEAWKTHKKVGEENGCVVVVEVAYRPFYRYHVYAYGADCGYGEMTRDPMQAEEEAQYFLEREREKERERV